MDRRCWTLRLLLLLHILIVINQAGASPGNKTIRIGYLASYIQDGGAINVAIEQAQNDGLLTGFNFRYRNFMYVYCVTSKPLFSRRAIAIA